MTIDLVPELPLRSELDADWVVSLEVSTGALVSDLSFLAQEAAAAPQNDTALREAIGEGRSPLDQTADGPTASSTRAIRARVRKSTKAGRLWLPAFPFAKEIDVGPIPSILPRGPSLRILGVVERLERRRAILSWVKTVSSDQPDGNEIPGLNRCKVLERDLRIDHGEWGDRLRRAMDARESIELPVVVALDWVTGAARSFQLQALQPTE